MEENNVLSKGVYLLYEIKDDLQRNDELRERVAVLAGDEKATVKQLETARKTLASEINSTISKRRADIENSFNSQLNTNRTRMKKVQARRANAKSSKVSMRIKNETETLREEIRSNKEEIRSIFTRSNIPRIFNNAFCYAIFMPKTMPDFGILGLCMLVVLLLPVFVCLVLLPEKMQGALAMILFYLIFIGLFGFLYYFIRKNWYLTKRKEFREAKRCREEISKIKKKITKKEQRIRNDTDESGYELEKFDMEINDIQSQIDRIVEEKKNALNVFENQTKRDITTDISVRLAPKIEENEARLERIQSEKHIADSELNELTVKISKSYEAYLGKDVLSVSVIDSLIDIMNNEDVETIADAVDCYKKNVDKSLQTL